MSDKSALDQAERKIRKKKAVRTEVRMGLKEKLMEKENVSQAI